MLLLLPLGAFLLFLSLSRKYYQDWQRPVLAGSIFFGVAIVAITEILSAFQQVTRRGVALSWLGVVIAGIILQRILGNRNNGPRDSEASGGEGGSDTKLDGNTKVLLGAVGVVAGVVGLTAVLCPPNVWDAMEYQLPRAVMWMNQHSVRFFATPDYAQLMFGPWAEYATMHVNLLWGSDRFVNLVEFFSFLGSLVGIAWIAKRLGAGVRGQAFAILVCATIPEGVLEASRPMNTYVVSF